MNIYNLFSNSAQRYPDLVAIKKEREWIKFSELEKAVDQTAEYFIKSGIQKGDRVLVFVPMSINLYRIVLALFKIGAAAVFLDEWVSWKRLNVCCKLADCKAFIAGFKIRFLGIFSSEIRKIPIKLSVGGFTKNSDYKQIEDVSEDHPALITFTTGSTGIPKAALRSHNFLLQQFKVLNEEVQPKAGEVCLTTLPILVFINLGNAITTLLTTTNNRKPTLSNARKIHKELISSKVNRIISSPFFIKQLSKSVLDSNLEFPSLQSIFTGGAPVFPFDAKLFRAAFPKVSINIVFGSTEAEPISSLTSNELIDSTESNTMGLNVGKVNSQIKVKVIKFVDDVLTWNTLEDITHIPEPRGGEIIVSGEHVLDTYFKNPEAILRNKIVGLEGKIWHRTGDSGYLVGNSLFLTGRCNTLFTNKGNLVFPFVFEEQLSHIPGINIGTIVLVDQQPLIIIEVDSKSNKAGILTEIGKINYLNAEVKLVNKIPRDPRHFSKIDYGRLIC